MVQSNTLCICIPGIHIPSRAVVPEDYNLVRTMKVTAKIALWASIKGFAQPQNLFKKSYMILYIFLVFWLILIHLKRLE